jgi:hypothetical protein
VRVEGLKMGLSLRWELGEIVGGLKIRVLEREGLRVFEKKLREKEETAIIFLEKKICLVLGKLPSLVLAPTTPTFPSRSQCPHHSKISTIEREKRKSQVYKVNLDLSDKKTLMSLGLSIMGFGISPGLSSTAKTTLETNSCCFSLRPSSTAKQTNPNLALLELLAGREVYHANVRSSCVVMILQTLHLIKSMARIKTP